jgi:hypothetical protein
VAVRDLLAIQTIDMAIKVAKAARSTPLSCREWRDEESGVN